MPRILVVDDQKAVAEGLASYLARPDLEVVTVNDLESARSELRTRSFDLVLSDLRMSDPDGQEGLELLRETRSNGRARLFALMTGFATEAIESAAREGGVDAFLPKPLDLTEVDRLVDDLLVPEPVSRRRMSDEEARTELERWASAGDQRAFETLVRAFTPLVYAVALKWYHLSREEAEDVFQDVMTQLVLKGREIRNVRLWLIGTSVNVSRRKIGAASRQRRIAERWLQERNQEAEFHEEPEEDLRELVWTAVMLLPEPQQRLLRLLYRDGASYEEISDRLGMPLGSIGPTRGRILKKVAALIRQLETEPQRAAGRA